MELRHLRCFVAVAEEGHITGAAERLSMQQPPLSRLIKKIESEVGALLFRRKARGVELTESGRAFYDKACAILKDLDAALEMTRSTARGEQGRLRVGVTATSPFIPFVPRVIRKFREDFPLVACTVDEQLSIDLIEHLRSGRMDVAFMWTPPRDDVAVIPLIEEELVAALPAGHHLARTDGDIDEARISLADLDGENFIVYGRRDGFGLFAATIVACRASGFSPRFRQEAPRLAAALCHVAAGYGVCIVPSSIRRVMMEGVVYRRLGTRADLKTTLFLSHRRGFASPVAAKFVELVRKEAKTNK